MYKDFSISRFVLGLFLSLVIMMPSFVMAGHIFEEHEHISCNEVKTHLHEAKVDCSLCDFHFSSFDFEPELTIDFLTHSIILTSVDNYTSSDFNTSHNTYLLRGPPAIS